MRFAGKELDPESALMNFEARYYRNTWGRFTQVDPVLSEAALGDPQRWNRYAYASNNPLRFVDPFGTCQYDPTTDRFTNTDGCVSLTVTAPYVDVVGAPVCIGYNANGEPYQQVSCSDQAIPGGDAYSGGGPQPGRSYPVIYPSKSTLPNTVSAAAVAVVVTTNVVAAPIVIPTEAIVGGAVVATAVTAAVIHDNWDDIAGAVDRFTTWIDNTFFQTRKGERGAAARPDGTPNEFKHMKPHPTKPDKVIYKDPHTGKDIVKNKPGGFDDWWNSR
jgi:RHS repeat-associated protein